MYKSLLKIAIHAIPISIIILSLFYYWFVILDRNIIFLYYHDMGPRVPDTSPFSDVTSSRYWMSGLVANGFIFILYSLFIFFRSRINNNYRPPIWWHIFIFCIPIIISVTLIITMTMNHPVLPFNHAVKVVTATLAGLAVGLYSSHLAQKKLINYILLGIDGFAIALIMNSSTWLEDLSFLPEWRIVILIKLYAISIFLLLITTAVIVWKKISTKVHDLFIFSLAIASIFGAVFHYIYGTSGHYYISNSANFFIQNIIFQILIWVLALLLVSLLEKLRNSINVRQKHKYI